MIRFFLDSSFISAPEKNSFMRYREVTLLTPEWPRSPASTVEEELPSSFVDVSAQDDQIHDACDVPPSSSDDDEEAKVVKKPTGKHKRRVRSS